MQLEAGMELETYALHLVGGEPHLGAVRLIVLKYLPIMLCCTVPKIYLLCSTNATIVLKLCIARVHKIKH